MLKNLLGMSFIGDLSLQDADILAMYGKKSKSILEFGAGGSTQILSQCNANSIISVETDDQWAELTRHRVNKISNATYVNFVKYTTSFDKKFDLIFVDGISNLREDFALNTWKNLNVGGVMIFHDTRVKGEYQKVLSLLKDIFNEVSYVETNAVASNGKSSNMTIIHKKDLEDYENWNKLENKPKWSYGGFGEPDLELWRYE